MTVRLRSTRSAVASPDHPSFIPRAETKKKAKRSQAQKHAQAKRRAREKR